MKRRKFLTSASIVTVVGISSGCIENIMSKNGADIASLDASNFSENQKNLIFSYIARMEKSHTNGKLPSLEHPVINSPLNI
ncbi:hypothetical protein [Haladaptatus cibarius]|uniref:hypothetical protein n=1 Tax=Haladaptatus cibarius TaxID=453847 RepID=UPI001185BC12|nr:hypothetical protein [Haladaptatus cibarius]